MRAHVIISGRNTERWAAKCLQSVLDQDYDDLVVTWIDDASDDKSVEAAFKLCAGYIPDCNRRYVNHTRRGALFNYVERARFGFNYREPRGHDAIICVDGDDWLPNSTVVSKVMAEFDKGAWVVYGRFTTTVPRPLNWATGRYTSNDFRAQGCKTAGLRAFRQPLVAKIADDDLKLGGWWQQSAWDNALMYPMLEMAGLDRIAYIDEPIYVYNIREDSDSNLCPELQAFAEWYSRFRRPRHRRLETLDSRPERYQHPNAIRFTL